MRGLSAMVRMQPPSPDGHRLRDCAENLPLHHDVERWWENAKTQANVMALPYRPKYLPIISRTHHHLAKDYDDDNDNDDDDDDHGMWLGSITLKFSGKIRWFCAQSCTIFITPTLDSTGSIDRFYCGKMAPMLPRIQLSGWGFFILFCKLVKLEPCRTVARWREVCHLWWSKLWVEDELVELITK